MAFATSAGVQTSIILEALWLDNGDREWILLTIDSIYSNDELVREVERRIEDSTGINVEGKVIISASHTHHAPATYSDQVPFILGEIATMKKSSSVIQPLANLATQLLIVKYQQKSVFRTTPRLGP